MNELYMKPHLHGIHCTRLLESFAHERNAYGKNTHLVILPHIIARMIVFLMPSVYVNYLKLKIFNETARNSAILSIPCPDGGMADASVSKTDTARCVGSSPTPGTIYNFLL